jgi:hypothetical protein
MSNPELVLLNSCGFLIVQVKVESSRPDANHLFKEVLVVGPRGEAPLDRDLRSQFHKLRG